MAKSRKRVTAKKRRRKHQKINWQKYPIIFAVLTALFVVLTGLLFAIGTVKIFDGALYYRVESIDEYRVYDRMLQTCNQRAVLEETPIGAFVAYCEDDRFHLFYRAGETTTMSEMFAAGSLSVEQLPAYVYFVRIPHTPLYPPSMKTREVGIEQAVLLAELEAFYAYIYGADARDVMQPAITFIDDFDGEQVGEVRVRFSAELRDAYSGKKYYANPPGTLSEVVTMNIVPEGDENVMRFDPDVPMDLRHIDRGQYNHASFEAAYIEGFCAYHDLSSSACSKVSIDTSDVDFNTPSQSWEDYPFYVDVDGVRKEVYVHIYAIDEK